MDCARFNLHLAVLPLAAAAAAVVAVVAAAAKACTTAAAAAFDIQSCCTCVFE